MRRIWSAMALMFLAAGSTGRAESDPRVGLLEDCSSTSGWIEWDDNQKEIPPRVKMESKGGLLYVHLNRGLLAVQHDWMPEGVRKGSILRKNCGEVDLDKFHYLVVKVKEKGSGIFFGVNGFDTKCGYTTGVTAVDLADYDDERIHGKRTVRFEMDLHDNLTTLVLDEIKLVSELTPEEKAHFIDRGLTIRAESLKFQQFHGLDAILARAKTPPPVLDGEEMAIFRDSATGAVTTRLTADTGDDNFGEGGIWSADGAAIRFDSSRKLDGRPVLVLAEGRVIASPRAHWALWSPTEPTKLWLVSRGSGNNYACSLWDRATGKTESVASFSVPQIGGYTEVKRFTKSGKLIVGFRETPHMAVIDPKTRSAQTITLSTRLKDVGFSDDEKYVIWANCYTYETLWRELATGKEGLAARYEVGHSSGGESGTVGSFGLNLKIFVTPDLFNVMAPGDRVKVWANWQNEVTTDYGSLTDDNEWIFTNGTDGDVANQHVMIPSSDTGAVLRVARYFTKFSWSSTTYSRPSPDYTKLVYNENMDGRTSSELMMAYTRLPDPPRNLKLAGKRLTWEPPARAREVAGYNVYGTDKSGRDYVRLNEKPVTGASYDLPRTPGFYAITAVEHSGLEGQFAEEVSSGGSMTLCYEAEDLKLQPPARRFFDGYASSFQCVRVNAESPAEKAADGVISIDLSSLPAGSYHAWARVRGKGVWTVAGKAAPVDSEKWTWIRLADSLRSARGAKLDVSSRDDSLMCDMVMLTTEEFAPQGRDPRDSAAPAPVKNLRATTDGGRVTFTWDASPEPDVRHYSVYCGTREDVPCDNSTLVRSVLKTSVADVPPAAGKLYYRVVAVDSRFNEGEPATVAVDAK